MEGKKDPGKFTVRFNIADPLQRAAAELLNQQGRCKAQFITNAVLFYTGATPSGQAFLQQGIMAPHRTKLDTLAEAEQSVLPPPRGDANLEDSDVASIRRTMEAFRFP